MFGSSIQCMQWGSSSRSFPIDSLSSNPNPKSCGELIATSKFADVHGQFKNCQQDKRNWKGLWVLPYSLFIYYTNRFSNSKFSKNKLMGSLLCFPLIIRTMNLYKCDTKCTNWLHKWSIILYFKARTWQRNTKKRIPQCHQCKITRRAAKRTKRT